VNFDFGMFSAFLSTCIVAQGFGVRLASVVACGCRIPDELFTSSCDVSNELTLSVFQNDALTFCVRRYRAGNSVMNWELGSVTDLGYWRLRKTNIFLVDYMWLFIIITEKLPQLCVCRICVFIVTMED